MKRCICILLAMLLAAFSCASAELDFSGMSLEELYEARAQLEQRIAEMEREADTLYYESGSYMVGRDIPAGDYALYETDETKIATAVVRAGESEDADLVTYHLVNGQAVIRLEPDTWLTLSEARACPIAQAEDALDAEGRTGEGGFLAGVQLPTGRYAVEPAEKAPLSSYSVYGDILGTGAQLLKFEVLHESVEIELQSGEYIELSGCTLCRLA